MISGPCKGAVGCDTVHFSNPDPGACFTEKGVTRLDTVFASFTIKGCGKENIACFGGGYETFTPGLRTTT